ncbi:hypothetical protein F4814DRAFT_420486 [Daldinia grandis]|nr:hypothetical protein F4814DRAFT_420486 [Daldinia grandis]
MNILLSLVCVAYCTVNICRGRNMIALARVLYRYILYTYNPWRCPQRVCLDQSFYASKSLRRPEGRSPIGRAHNIRGFTTHRREGKLRI